MRHVAFSPDGKTVASEWRIWDVATGQVLVTFRDRDEEKNRSANFFPIFYSPDGKQMITTENEGARIWDIRSGKEARWAVRARIHHDQVALSPDGRYLATGWALSVPSAVEFLRGRLQPATAAEPQGIPAVNGPVAPPEVLRTVRDRGAGAGGDARSPGRPRVDGTGKPRRSRDPRREVGSQPLQSPTGDSSRFLDQMM